MIAIEEASPEDRDAILALRKRCFPEVDAEKMDPRFWHWEFLEAPAGAARIHVAHGEAKTIVAHIGLVPQTYLVSGKERKSALAVDGMSDPDHRRGGLFTRVTTAATEDALVRFDFATAYQIRPASLAGMLRSGWRTTASVPVLVRPASLTAIVWPFGSPKSSSHRVPRAGREGPRLLGSDDVADMADVAASMFAGDCVHLQRDALFLSWRFFRNPLWRYEVTGVERDGVLAAYLVVRRTKLKGFDTLAIADVAFRPGANDSLDQLLKDALLQARAQTVQLAATFITPQHPAYRSFRRRWFIPTHQRFRLLTAAQGETAAILARGRWGLTWADTDHL